MPRRRRELPRSSRRVRLEGCVLTLVIFLHASPARAKPGEWQVDAKASYIVLGALATRATGGLMPSLTAWYIWPVRAVNIGLGADFGVFGLGGGAHWMGVLGGPTVGVRAHPRSVPLSFELSARLDFGRIPVCNNWGLCLRYVGFFPAGEAGVAYSPTTKVAAVAACGVRFIQTIAWTGVSVEPAASARIFW